jgi:dolichyl-phosphate beta-glucosyltransferase
MSALDLSIIVPAFNEEHRIEPTLDSLALFASTQPWRVEILVVDDGSTDGTVALCRQLANRLHGLRVIETRPNRGKGHAVRVGMRAANGAVRVMVDADGSTPASELPKLIAPLLAGEAAVAIGSRYEKARRTDQPLWRRAWSRLANVYVQRALVPGVRDTHCGFKAFTAAAADDLFGQAVVDGWAFDLEILALAQRRGHSIAAVGVIWNDDPRSRVRPLKDLVDVLREVVTIRRRLRG